MSEFKEPEFSVVRQHEEFIWLHDRFEEDEEYAGCIIRPAPPRPDFDSSREKLQRLGIYAFHSCFLRALEYSDVL